MKIDCILYIKYEIFHILNRYKKILPKLTKYNLEIEKTQNSKPSSNLKEVSYN